MPSPKVKEVHNFDDLSPLVSEEVGGILWIDSDSLEKRKAPFSWFDYLFNLTLSKTENASFDGNRYFFTKNFQKNLVLCHLPFEEDLEKKIAHFLDFVKKSDSFGKETLLINSSGIKLKNKLKEKLSLEIKVIDTQAY